MRRREFIALLGSSAAVWPGAAFAQTPDKRRRVGLLEYSRPDVERVHLWDIFRQRLRDLGYVEGDNIAFVQRWADGTADRLPALAAELVEMKVDIITTAGTPSAQAAMQATSTIPIVMATGNDPVGVGIVSSLSRPTGNVTGVVTLVSELAPKRLELLQEVIPHLTRIATLVDLGNASSVLAEHETEPAAKTLGITLQVVNVQDPKELESAFRSMLEPRVDALVIQVSAMFFGERNRLAELAAKERIATIVSERAYAEAGCLITYGAGFANTFRRAAEYVDKILKGAKPADLPIEQPTKFELVINLRTAKALGLTVPPALLARADEVIE
jgi:putative tryptophan/tyrosine transport system substrate-binding protein